MARINGITADTNTVIIYNLISDGTYQKPVRTDYITSITGLPVRAVRNFIKNLIFDYGIPIGSSRNSGKQNGYYIIKDAQGLIATILPIRAQVREELRRINRIKKNYNTQQKRSNSDESIKK